MGGLGGLSEHQCISLGSSFPWLLVRSRSVYLVVLKEKEIECRYSWLSISLCPLSYTCFRFVDEVVRD